MQRISMCHTSTIYLPFHFVSQDMSLPPMTTTVCAEGKRVEDYTHALTLQTREAGEHLLFHGTTLGNLDFIAQTGWHEQFLVIEMLALLFLLFLQLTSEC